MDGVSNPLLAWRSRAHTREVVRHETKTETQLSKEAIDLLTMLATETNRIAAAILDHEARLAKIEATIRDMTISIGKRVA